MSSVDTAESENFKNVDIGSEKNVGTENNLWFGRTVQY